MLPGENMFKALVSDNLVGSPPSLHSVCISSLSKLNFWSQLVHSKELDMVAFERDRQDTLGAAQIELFTVLTQNIQRIYILDISIRLNHQFPLSQYLCLILKESKTLDYYARIQNLIKN